MANKTIFHDFLIGFAAFLVFGCATTAIPTHYRSPKIPDQMTRQAEARFKETGERQVDYRTPHGNFRCKLSKECPAEHGLDDCIEFTMCLALAD